MFFHNLSRFLGDVDLSWIFVSFFIQKLNEKIVFFPRKIPNVDMAIRDDGVVKRVVVKLRNLIGVLGTNIDRIIGNAFSQRLIVVDIWIDLRIIKRKERTKATAKDDFFRIGGQKMFGGKYVLVDLLGGLLRLEGPESIRNVPVDGRYAGTDATPTHFVFQSTRCGGTEIQRLSDEILIFVHIQVLVFRIVWVFFIILSV